MHIPTVRIIIYIFQKWTISILDIGIYLLFYDYLCCIQAKSIKSKCLKDLITLKAFFIECTSKLDSFKMVSIVLQTLPTSVRFLEVSLSCNFHSIYRLRTRFCTLAPSLSSNNVVVYLSLF